MQMNTKSDRQRLFLAKKSKLDRITFYYVSEKTTYKEKVTEGFSTLDKSTLKLLFDKITILRKSKYRQGIKLYVIRGNRLPKMTFRYSTS